MRLARACMCVPFFQSSAYLTTSARGFGGKPAGDRRSRARGNINIAEPIAPADALRETGERKKLKRRGLRATLAREKPLFSEAWRWPRGFEPSIRFQKRMAGPKRLNRRWRERHRSATLYGFVH